MFLVILLASMLASTSDCEQGRVHTFPGGLEDGLQRVAYVRSGDGYIDALALDSGTRMWRSDTKGTPIAVYKGNLIAAFPGPQHNFLSIVLLDQRKGAPNRSIGVSFPDTVNTAASSFVYRVTEANNELRIAWAYSTPRRGGASQRFDAGLQIPSRSGLKKIDFNTGSVADIEPEDAQKSSAAGDGEQFSNREIPTSAFDPWKVGNSFVHVDVRNVRSQKDVLLVTKRESGVTESRVLLSGENPSAYRSSDGCYVFLLGKSPDESQPWRVFSAPAGTMLGEVEFEPGSAEPEVIGSVVYWLLTKHKQPNVEIHTIEAADLVTGKLLWSYLLGIGPSEQGTKRLE
jgi:hypothetical protein